MRLWRCSSGGSAGILVTISALAVGLLVAAACGGGGGGAGAEETPTPVPATPTAEATQGATPAGGEEATPVEDLGAELEDLAQLWQQREAKVVYQFRSESAGEIDEGSLILYWKAPDWRADFQSGTELASIVQRDQNLYVCQEADRVCFRLPVQGPMPIPMPFFFLQPSDIPELVRERVIEGAAGVQIERSTRTIAGQEARCYSVTGGGGAQGTFELCWTEDGILLRASGSFTDAQGNNFTTNMEATSVERTVSDQDLAPPYSVQELPGGLPSPVP